MGRILFAVRHLAKALDNDIVLSQICFRSPKANTYFTESSACAGDFLCQHIDQSTIGDVMQRTESPPLETSAVGTTASRRTLAGYLSILLRGFAMGSADVVPGVSGGTIAFITGIYEELLDSIRMVGRPPFIRAVLGLRIREALKLINFPFLIALIVGIGTAVVTLAPGIEWLLENEPILIWSFFFGLIVASVWMVSQKIMHWAPLVWIMLVIGTVGAYWIVGLVPTQTPETWWFLILSGALAICAMILPGISGSFILLLLSKYQFFVSAVNQRDIVSLALAAIGAAVGIVSFAQILSWLFKRYHDLTVALLTGFMIGSLRKVWPWKVTLETVLDRHGVEIPIRQQNILPPVSNELMLAIVIALVGFGVVMIIERLAGSKATDPHV